MAKHDVHVDDHHVVVRTKDATVTVYLDTTVPGPLVAVNRDSGGATELIER